MTIKVGINGFGRIGRMILRAYFEQQPENFEIVAINDLAPVETSAHLFKYDSVHGRFDGNVSSTADSLTVNGKTMTFLSNPNPEDLGWDKLGVELVLECSGRFSARDDAAKHLKAGAKKVIVSAPSKGADLTVVYGVNHDRLTNDHEVISNASCTTNCLAPVAHVLNQAIGIEKGFMTTIHSYTGDQRLVDTYHDDPHRARAASLNLIPTSTGAAKAVGLVLPELDGKLDGVSIRVPTPNVSTVDLKFVASRDTSVEEVNKVIVDAANGALKGVLEATDEALVSMDFNHHPASSIFDCPQTKVMDGNFVRIMSWYDNEWGFSCRMIDTTDLFARILANSNDVKMAS